VQEKLSLATKMKNAKKILKEVDRSLRRLGLFFVIVKTLVLVTVFYLLLYLIGVEPYYAFIPAFIYFISSLIIQNQIDNVRKVENKYIDINHKLKTARDYQDKENSILNSLEEDLIIDLKKVELSSFFSYSKTFLLIFILLISVSASIYIASKNLKIIDFNSVVKDMVKRLNIEENETEEIKFTGGEESIMQVGNEKMQVQINPVGLDFDFNEVTEPADYEFTTSFPKEVFISSGAASGNEFTEEQQVLIKKYFEKKLARGG
jgi:hypothetical protein